ncbi:hypothetical protein BOO71_0006466 [Deinococcus marmoris]|uniref:Uncharacterized protein n=1 Tax=Deinococcus marmoris TaxID=249408 RepID=A0A1U7NZB8_9DEIO|nr:hypothetical protein BOO71_0006466 [Deinococcus marmoris]
MFPVHTFGISPPPHLREALDAAVTAEISSTDTNSVCNAAGIGTAPILPRHAWNPFFSFSLSSRTDCRREIAPVWGYSSPRGRCSSATQLCESRSGFQVFSAPSHRSPYEVVAGLISAYLLKPSALKKPWRKFRFQVPCRLTSTTPERVSPKKLGVPGEVQGSCRESVHHTALGISYPAH